MRINRRIKQAVGLLTCIVIAALLISLQSAQAQSGGAIVVNVRAGGQPAKADVIIKTTAVEPEHVAKGRAGSPISVPSGTYDVEVICSELIDRPQQQLRGVVVAGETVEREATFPAGTVTLHVRRGGRVLKAATLNFTRAGGEDVEGTAKSGIPFKASPGRYDAEIIISRGRKKMSHSITGIQVYDGATRNLPVSL